MTEDSSALGARERALVAVSEAQARWREVLEVIAEAPDRDAADRALAEAFGFDALQTTVVLDLQFGRVTHSERRRIDEELSMLRGSPDVG